MNRQGNHLQKEAHFLKGAHYKEQVDIFFGRIHNYLPLYKVNITEKGYVNQAPLPLSRPL
jgi:hypothetical protein